MRVMGLRKRFEEDFVHKQFLFDRIEGDWVWCLHCGRAYLKQEMRWDPRQEIFRCKYPDCSGDAYLDAWSWSVYRQGRNWPDVPEEGAVYHLYGAERGSLS